jgi:cold shock CspA family protein
MTELIPALRTGTVVAFDAQVGLGEVEADDGSRLPFHCIVIADGSRSIEVGARVSFDLLAKLGRWEASSIRPA